ncbi:MAG TPA: hypothetical protein ENI27_09565 [bacterium]|nr:hypothetical protein [bacterium]
MNTKSIAYLKSLKTSKPWVLIFITVTLFVLSKGIPVDAKSQLNQLDITTTMNLTSTATQTITSTIAPAATQTATTMETPISSSVAYLPFIIRQPTATPKPYISPVTRLFCDSLAASLNIPDNNSVGVARVINVSDTREITDLDVTLDITHSWVGDLVVSLTHQETGRSVILVNRPGIPSTATGCGSNNIKAILDDEISSPVDTKCASSSPAISGIYIPTEPLDSFDGESMAGNWMLSVSDNNKVDTGYLRNWCLVASISDNPPPPTPTPTLPTLPSKAKITGISGLAQSLPLDCESRSAVDWAKYYGNHINEITFFKNLPHSDNPDKGFVGNVYGTWGQIPPNPYGVHAEPVASLLRAYGLSAYAHRQLSWDQLRAEISAGHPVIVWIVGSVVNGIPVYYTPSDGLSTVVARYEHTVIVTGYTKNSVSFLNGDTIYTRSLEQFLDSWSVMRNMAITSHP